MILGNDSEFNELMRFSSLLIKESNELEQKEKLFIERNKRRLCE